MGIIGTAFGGFACLGLAYLAFRFVRMFVRDMLGIKPPTTDV